MPLALPGQVFALALLALSLSAQSSPPARKGQPIMQPATRAEYEAFKTAQGEASNKAYQSGDAARTKVIEEAVLVAARKFGDRREEASSIYGLGMAAMAMGDPAGAETLFRQSIDLWKDIDDQKGVALGLRGLGRVLESRGRLAEATEVQVTALELLLKYGTPIDQSESYYSLAKLFVTLEDYPAARHGVDRAIELMGATPPDFPLGLNLALRSAVLRELGDHKRAVADGQAALAAFARQQSRVGEAIGQLALGNALAASGQPERGLALLGAGVATAGDLEETVLRADLLVAQGTVLVDEQRFNEALVPLQEAERIADQLALDTLRRDASVELEQAWSGLGDPTRALAASKQAFAAQQRISGLSKVGQMAGRSAESQLAALNSKFLSLDPATRAGHTVLAPPKPARSLSWRWWLPLLLALAASLALAVRHMRRLRSSHGDLQSQHAQLRGRSEQLQQQVSIDPLTGVLTRRAFNEDLAAMLQSAQAKAGPVTLVVFDLDHFKQINDRHGHATGDAALKRLAGLVREQLDSDDLFGRFGGDEFLIACSQPLPAVAELAERIRAAVAQRSSGSDSGLPPFSISMGLADVDAGADKDYDSKDYDSEVLFKRADAALYAAKAGGRNRVVVRADEQG